MSRIGTCGCAAAEPEAIAGPEPLRYGSWHSGNDSPREGQHFRFDHLAGVRLGESVADFVTDHFLGARESDDERGDR